MYLFGRPLFSSLGYSSDKWNYVVTGMNSFKGVPHSVQFYFHTCILNAQILQLHSRWQTALSVRWCHPQSFFTHLLPRIPELVGEVEEPLPARGGRQGHFGMWMQHQSQWCKKAHMANASVPLTLPNSCLLPLLCGGTVHLGPTPISFGVCRFEFYHFWSPCFSPTPDPICVTVNVKLCFEISCLESQWEKTFVFQVEICSLEFLLYSHSAELLLPYSLQSRAILLVKGWQIIWGIIWTLLFLFTDVE